MKLKFITLLLLLVSAVSFGQTITGIFLPQVVQGAGTFDPADDRKVPFVSRMKLSGLTPNATYRYFNTFVGDTTDTGLGEGNYILVKDSGNFVRVTAPTLATPGEYGEFTTDANGSYTGWFINEVSEAGIFSPGNAAPVFLRIVLNNGAGGIRVVSRLTSPSPITVINFGSDAMSGTGLRCTPLRNGSAKQFVFLYDDLLGPLSGKRPVTGSFIESDGTDNSVANGYAPFYADSVNSVNKTWGTILPNALSNGILHIIQWPLKINNSLPLPDRIYLSLDGKWPGVNRTTINTKNAAGGLSNVLVIDGARLSIVNLWLNGEATDEETITMEWSTPDEPNAREYVIEKSVDGGKTFVPFSRLTALGNKPVYTITDKRSESAAFYRVNLVGKDGSKVSSEVLAVQGVMKISVYPNPVQNQLLMQHPAADAGATVQVVGIDGRQLFTQNIQQGAVQTTINVSRLIPGNYMVVLKMNGQRESRSFIKK